MVLCSHFKYPICDYVYSYSISLRQTLFWNMSLAPRTKQWTAQNLQKLCAQEPGAHVCARVQGLAPAPCPKSFWYLKIACVHISAQRVPYFGTIHVRAAGVNAALKIIKICFNPKVSIQPCRPKSDSALPGAIWAQFRPKKLNQKAILAHARAHFSPWDQISPS